MAIKSFRKGQSTYTCRCCGRTTRDVHGEGHTGNCYECFELAGFENMLSDDGELSPSSINTIRSYFEDLMSKGVTRETCAREFADIYALAFDEGSVTTEEDAVTVEALTKNTKYVYPAGLTDAQKKAFRAKARRAK